MDLIHPQRHSRHDPQSRLPPHSGPPLNEELGAFHRRDPNAHPLLVAVGDSAKGRVRHARPPARNDSDIRLAANGNRFQIGISLEHHFEEPQLLSSGVA